MNQYQNDLKILVRSPYHDRLEGGVLLETLEKPYLLTLETFDALDAYWREARQLLRWECLFVTPAWLKVWWRTFADGATRHLCVVRRQEEILGIAPLMIQGSEARFIGDTDVCDYLDFIVAPHQGDAFFTVLMNHLLDQGITRMDLGLVRPDSITLTEFATAAKKLECEVHWFPEDVGAEMMLPRTWDGFLNSLKGKQRHEVRRKLRRLHEAGSIDYRMVEDVGEVQKQMDLFLALFRSNRSDKAEFMNSRMDTFFRALAQAMVKQKIMKLCFLDIDQKPVAAVMSFDYNGTMHLYNNGYDHQFHSLSVSLLSKVLNIKESIERGMKKYDFLKGDEAYKHRLGGQEVPLYRCQVKLQ